MEAIRILIVSALECAGDAISAKVRDNQPNAETMRAANAFQARNILAEKKPEAAIICAPLPDDDGVSLAGFLHRHGCAGVMLLLPPEQARALHAANTGIVSMSMTADAALFDACFCFLTALMENERRLEAERKRMQSQLDELRLISRAKLLLISRCHMSEPEAQHYIECAAMNTCCTKAAAARKIVCSCR
jgi:AmiR/NasT family two-component response regulator